MIITNEVALQDLQPNIRTGIEHPSTVNPIVSQELSKIVDEKREELRAVCDYLLSLTLEIYKRLKIKNIKFSKT